MTSSFDTFMGRPRAWCGEALRQAASTSRFDPRSKPLPRKLRHFPAIPLVHVACVVDGGGRDEIERPSSRSGELSALSETEVLE